MKVFEILFILLLLVPVALLMRFLISKLSRETPKQRRGAYRADEEKPSIRAWMARKNQETDPEEEEMEPEEEMVPPPVQHTRPEPAGYRQNAFSRAEYTASRAEHTSSHAEQTSIRAEYTPPQTEKKSSNIDRYRTQLKRTERIPFSEIYGYEQPEPVPNKASEQQQMDAAGRLEARRASATKKKPARSEQTPSKRQKRKNRARSRKRQASKREKTK